MNIRVDTREKDYAIVQILAEFERQGVTYHRKKCDEGDYFEESNPTLIIDRKRNLNELCQNLGSDRSRFYREVKRAAAKGEKLIILCEHGGKIHSIEDVKDWSNPLLNPRHPNYAPSAMTGRELMERIYRVHISYGVDFVFCDKRNTGKKIIDIFSHK